MNIDAPEAQRVYRTETRETMADSLPACYRPNNKKNFALLCRGFGAQEE